MIMKDTTAVEFLAKSLKDFPHIKHSFRFRELVEQAKEMEKEQMRLADMKEHTLQDVADDITGVIGSLAYFVESEALDVNGLMDRLEAIRSEIEETLD